MIMRQFRLFTLSIKFCGSAGAISRASNHLAGPITLLKKNFFHWYHCIFDDYRFKQRSKPTDLLFFIDFPPINGFPSTMSILPFSY